jgi:hypothetical protein
MSTLQDAVALIKAGDRQGGQRILAALLAQDPANEAAWLWMSSVVDRDEQRRHCLEQVLKHNPGHAVARAGLARLQASTAEEEALPSPASPAELPPTAEQARAWQQAQTPVGVGDIATHDHAADRQAPTSPNRDPAMTIDMADFVIAQIAKHEGLDNIVLKLCEVSGMSWSEAAAFVQRVEEERRPEIARRRRPILLVVGVVSLLIGALLAYSSASYLADFAASTGGFSENPLIYILSTPHLARRAITLALATAILVGGLWGTMRALLPPGEKSLLEPAEGTGSIDDFVGIHVSLGDERVASSKRRGKRT